jgi:hypothetical protein
MHKRLMAAALLAVAAVAHAGEAAKVQVKLATDLNQYADFGETPLERERNARDLKQVFEDLGAELAPGQTLSVEVLQVNLAGELEWVRGAERIRVMREIGWPLIEVRYTVRQGGAVSSEGTARISDMAYLSQSRPSEVQGPLGFERRMLQRWLKTTLATRP